MMLLMWMDDRLVDVRPDDFEPGSHAILLSPTGDGEFRAACSCGHGTPSAPTSPAGCATRFDAQHPQGRGVSVSRPVRRCSVCGRSVHVGKDGTVYRHGTIGEMCEGSDKLSFVFRCAVAYREVFFELDERRPGQPGS